MVSKIMRVAAVGMLAASLAAAIPAGAKAGDVRKSGSCSGAAAWKLKLSPDNSNIQVEFEVDSHASGEAWRVRILKDGTKIFGGTRTTQAPSDSFTVHVLTPDPVGTDAFKARAVNVSTGEICVGKASI